MAIAKSLQSTINTKYLQIPIKPRYGFFGISQAQINAETELLTFLFYTAEPEHLKKSTESDLPRLKKEYDILLSYKGLITSRYNGPDKHHKQAARKYYDLILKTLELFTKELINKLYPTPESTTNP